MIVVLLLLIVCTAAISGAAAYGAGVAATTQRNRLNSTERRQFRDADALIDDLYGDAVTAETLGEAFGSIARDKITTYHRKANQ